MDTGNRSQIPAIIDDLCQRGRSYRLIQAIRMLSLYIRDSVNPGNHTVINIRSNLDLGPPTGEIIEINHRSVDRTASYQITTSLLEIYGTGSPLPLFYTEELIRDQARGYNATRDLLDMFNSLIYEAYFRSWQKCSIVNSLYESPNRAFWDRLYCFIGLGNTVLRKQFENPETLIAFAAIASRPVKTAEGLRLILAEITGEKNLEVEQCIVRKATIPLNQRCVLGKQANEVGRSVYLGKKIPERMNAIRIHIGPVSIEGFQYYLPSSPMTKIIRDIIHFYIDRLMVCDFKICVQTKDMKTINAGNVHSALLGWNTFLFSGRLKQSMEHAVFSLHK
jgi:type VI secretion system protein ImpH